MKINSIAPDKHKYLQIVTTIAKPPIKFFYSGTLPEDRVTSVAIVGTRKPTPYGREVTYQLAYDLAKQGVVIISGLALGIDGIAHKAALDAGGRTIAILANGLDTIYPSTHRSLAQSIIEKGGAILSEYDIGVEPRVYQFLARNRIVAALSDAVIVTEAAARSGTMATVAHALEQNKEIFAIPGNITSPMSSGCNTILKQGAHVLTSADDVLEILSVNLPGSQQLLPLGTTPLETVIIALLQAGIRDGDELQEKSSAPASDFAQALTMLEINGVIRALGANQWTLK
ncbi:MAG: hypothetical protein JWN33_577 [Candidatus Saccharibacteria bacterium]|nr:hypothetical protein [Candidatus Saccharibacteria bacterium]